MMELFDEIYQHFRSKSEYLSTFVKHNSREEAWFDAEITWLLDRKKDMTFDREKEYRNDKQRLPNRHVDFHLSPECGDHYIELKALLHGPNANLQRIKNDYERLSEWHQGQKWLLMVAYPYSRQQWQTWYEQKAKEFPKVEDKEVVEFPISEEQSCSIILWRIA
jgi:hypothetical protein